MSYFSGKSVDFPSAEAFEKYDALSPRQRDLLTEWGERWRLKPRNMALFPNEPGLEELVEAAWRAGRCELDEEHADQYRCVPRGQDVPDRK